MQQTDDVMDDDAKRFTAGLGIAVTDLHRDFFVLAEQHLGVIVVAIDKRVVQRAIAGAWVECNVRKIILADKVRYHIGLPAARRRYVFLSFRHFLTPCRNKSQKRP